jgi:pyrroloquinoline quinone (PQQ) biosynthesis protein C
MLEPLKATMREAIAEIASHPFVQSIYAGRCSSAQLASYLHNTGVLVEGTPGQIAHALERTNPSRSWLVAALRGAQQEEDGHHEWARQDLRALAPAAAAATTPAILELLAFVRAQTDIDPVLLLTYATFIEILTVELGPSVVRALVERCGHPLSALSVITNHVRLDEHHAQAGEELLEFAARESPDFVSLAQVCVRGAAQRYAVFLSHVLQADQRVAP